MQLSSDLGITQKTAWHILHKVRHLMGQDDGKLFGEVEMDEKHLRRYVDEEVFRWNSCERSTGGLFSWMFDRCSGRFTYKDVTLAA